MLYQSLVACIAILASVTAKSAWTWDLNVQETVVNDLKFHFFLREASSLDFWSIKHLLSFNNEEGKDGLGEIGFAPTQDEGLIVFFNVDIDGAEPITDSCSKRVGGAPGISCSVEIEAEFTSPIYLWIEKVQGDFWSTAIINDFKRYPLGEFSIPLEYTGMLTSQNGFLDAYLRRPLCATGSRIKLQIFRPETSDPQFMDDVYGVLKDFQPKPSCEQRENSQYIPQEDETYTCN